MLLLSPLGKQLGLHFLTNLNPLYQMVSCAMKCEKFNNKLYHKDHYITKSSNKCNS